MNVEMYNDILEVIKYQVECAKTDTNIPNDIFICDERSFKEFSYTDYSGAIFVIVKFEEGEINPNGSVLLPISFEVYSEEQTFENAREIITYLTQNNSFVSPQTPSGTFVRMFYSTPQMESAFEEDGSGFRATFTFNCTLFYGVGINGITNINVAWGEQDSEQENIKFISCSAGAGFTLHTANKGDKSDRATTTNASMTFVCSVNVISTADSNFVGLVDGILFGSTDINTDLTCTFTKGGSTYTKHLKIIDIDLDQSESGLPVYVIGLGE